MKARATVDQENRGCAILLALLFITAGVWSVAGAGFGLIALGIVFLLISLAAV